MSQLSFDQMESGESQAGVGARRFSTQLLKWIGNKQRFAPEIISFFPEKFDTYIEPFLGSGAVLGTLSPKTAIAADALKPLIEIWQTLRDDPDLLVEWYRTRWERIESEGKVACFEAVRQDYNRRPNGADLVFISRACYGGVLRFRQRDHAISTPCGVHSPIHPRSFAARVKLWRPRVSGTRFVHSDFEAIMDSAKRGDVVYCDPPYSYSQSILYGAQEFTLERLLGAIDRCKGRGARVILSIDGTKRSGDLLCDLAIPKDLFKREVMVHVGRSMLRRFQMQGETLEGEQVRDRLLLTF